MSHALDRELRLFIGTRVRRRLRSAPSVFGNRDSDTAELSAPQELPHVVVVQEMIVRKFIIREVVGCVRASAEARE